MANCAFFMVLEKNLCEKYFKNLFQKLLSFLAGGDPKPLYFFDAFRNGFLCDVQDKILYVYLDSFPDGYVADGWLADGSVERRFL